MSEKIIWGHYNFKGNPAKVYGELSTLGETTPESIVEYARENEESELHKCFTWDDTVAAERWRKQEEWENYMKTNTPYILGKAFKDSIKEAFISCGFKNGTGKNGTDLLRTTRFRQKNPVAFESVSPDQHLAMTSGLSRVNVLTQQNVFTNWECELEITFLPSEFPKETLIDLIRTSGMFIGVGSRRGEDYGRYHIGHIEYAEMEQ